jgi:hypothetical protein
LNAHTELQAKRQRSSREANYRNRPIFEWFQAGLTQKVARAAAAAAASSSSDAAASPTRGAYTNAVV